MLLSQLYEKNETLKSLYSSTYQIAINSMKRNKDQRKKYGDIQRPKHRLNRRKSLYKRRQLNDYQQPEQLQQAQQQLQVSIANTNEFDYAEERLREISRAESSITEISNLMAQLAGMVHGQGQILGMIQNNVGYANDNLDGVIANLQKYLARMGSNEWLMIKVFALIIFLAIFFAIFVA